MSLAPSPPEPNAPGSVPATGSAPRRSKHLAVRGQLELLMDRMAAGEPLPAERELAHDLGVARMTLRRAMDALVAEGRLIRRQGAGTFMAPRRLDQRLSATSFSQDMRSRGLTPGSRTLEWQQESAGMMLASVLDLEPTDPVLHVRRLRTADGEPMAVEDLYVPLKLTPGLSGSDLENASFYDVLADRFGLHISEGTQTVAPCLVPYAEADVLEVPAGSPAFMFERTSRVQDGRPIEFVRSHYRGDRCRLVVDIFPTRPPQDADHENRSIAQPEERNT